MPGTLPTGVLYAQLLPVAYIIAWEIFSIWLEKMSSLSWQKSYRWTSWAFPEALLCVHTYQAAGAPPALRMIPNPNRIDGHNVRVRVGWGVALAEGSRTSAVSA